jgi:hypothetical protein
MAQNRSAATFADDNENLALAVLIAGEAAMKAILSCGASLPAGKFMAIG